MERQRPYLLEVELARGAVNHLRSQLAQWEAMGLVASTPLRDEVRQATSQFARAATLQDDPAAAATMAEASLETTFRAMDQLADEYAAQSLENRRRQPRAAATWFGVHLNSQIPNPEVAGHLRGAFNMVSVPLNWRRIEAVEGRRNWDLVDAEIQWARAAGMKVCAGPLLELDDRGLPDWTYLWEGDVDSLLGFMLDHVRTAVERYRGRIHLWQVAARITRGRALALDEGARLQIAAQAISTVRELDPTTPLVVTFDQPWAEYLAGEHLDLAPLHFADALVRADLGLSGLGLELNVGYYPGASLHRPPLAYSRLIDTWSLLELPLLVALSLPSSASDDPRAAGKVRVLVGADDVVSPESQQSWIERHVPILLSNGQVQVVVWNQLSDAEPHHYPHGGLFDAEGRPKPALNALRDIRQRYVGSGK
jgi:GH35 family endo-1,4-beta-xylanase